MNERLIRERDASSNAGEVEEQIRRAPPQRDLKDPEASTNSKHRKTCWWSELMQRGTNQEGA